MKSDVRSYLAVAGIFVLVLMVGYVSRTLKEKDKPIETEVVESPDLEQESLDVRQARLTTEDVLPEGVELWAGRVFLDSDPIRHSEWRSAGEWFIIKTPQGEVQFSPQENGLIYIITRSKDGIESPGQLWFGGASNQMWIKIGE